MGFKVIDYQTLLTCKKSNMSHDQLTSMYDQLKSLANKYDIVITTTSSLTKNCNKEI